MVARCYNHGVSAVPAKAVRSFLNDCSVETSPHAAAEVARYPEYMPPGTEIYVAHPPNTSFVEVAELAEQLLEMGYRPVPHLIARQFSSHDELEQSFARLAGAGIRRALIVAGDIATPMGPFASTMDVMRLGHIEDYGFEDIGIAGYPEGTPATGPGRSYAALLEKVAFAAEQNLALYIVTQFGFHAEDVFAWEQKLLNDGVTLPIHVGMAGKISVARLLRYAARCGVTASARFLATRGSDMTQQLRSTLVDELVLAFAGHAHAHRDCLLRRAHFYAFGGAERTVRWLNAIQAGEVSLTSPASA